VKKKIEEKTGRKMKKRVLKIYYFGRKRN